MTFINILNASVSASWLVLAIIVLRFALKKAPKAFHCGLWALVAIRLLCPVSFESALSLVPTSQVVPEEYLVMEPRDDQSQSASLEIVENPVYPEAVEIQLDATVDRVQTLDVFLTLAWWTGMGAMAIYAVFSYLSLRLRTRVSVRLRENIWLCDDIDSPFILGILRPRICLPSAMEPEQMVHVIAHEKAHLKRLDHWWKPIGFALLTVHWFNPVMWAAYCLLCRDIELACDEKVIRDLDKASVRAYSEALIACGTRQRFVAACPLAFGEVGVKERVKRMLNYRKPGFWIILIALVLSIVLIVCFMTDPAPTTIGNLNEPQFQGLLENVEELYLVYGDQSLWQNGSDGGRDDIVVRLKGMEIDPDPVSLSVAEDRDRTYEVHIRGSILCISADFSQIWVDDGVKPSCSYVVKEPEQLMQLLGEYIPAIPAVSITWVGDELDRIVYQDGYRITGQEDAEVTLRLDVDALPADIYSQEGHTFGEHELIVYQNGATTAFVRHIGYDDPEQKYLICTFAFRYELEDRGEVLLPYRVNTENGVTESVTTAYGLKSKNIPDAGTVHEDGAYFRGANPGEEISINIRTEAMRTAKDYLECTLTGFQRLSYVRQELPEDAPAFSGTYVPYQCLYMNTLSSYASFSGDSGAVYQFSDSSFAIEARNGSVIVYDPIVWNWQPIDWTVEPFSGLIQGLGFPDNPDLSGILTGETVCQVLNSDDFLLYDSGRLMLANTLEDPKGNRYLWSVYSLVPEAQMGVAEWEFNPMLSSQYPAFRFGFDMAYTSITATCLDGTLTSFDEPSVAGYPSGTDLEFPAGTALYWSPVDENGNVVTDAKIWFTVYNGQETVASGTLYISGSQSTASSEGEDREFQPGVYTAKLIGTGLHLAQNEEQSGGIIEYME